MHDLDHPSIAAELATLLPVCDAALREAMAEAAIKYVPGGWKNRLPPEHLLKALRHITSYLCGDNCEDHLHRALTRLTMAIWQRNAMTTLRK